MNATNITDPYFMTTGTWDTNTVLLVTNIILQSIHLLGSGFIAKFGHTRIIKHLISIAESIIPSPPITSKIIVPEILPAMPIPVTTSI